MTWYVYLECHNAPSIGKIVQAENRNTAILQTLNEQTQNGVYNIAHIICVPAENCSKRNDRAHPGRRESHMVAKTIRLWCLIIDPCD